MYAFVYYFTIVRRGTRAVKSNQVDDDEVQATLAIAELSNFGFFHLFGQKRNSIDRCRRGSPVTCYSSPQMLMSCLYFPNFSRRDEDRTSLDLQVSYFLFYLERNLGKMHHLHFDMTRQFNASTNQ